MKLENVTLPIISIVSFAHSTTRMYKNQRHRTRNKEKYAIKKNHPQPTDTPDERAKRKIGPLVHLSLAGSRNTMCITTFVPYVYITYERSKCKSKRDSKN